MAARQPSRALQDALAALADMAPPDRGEILALLDPFARVRAERMLAAMRIDMQSGGQSSWQEAGFSEAMLARLDMGTAMTEEAWALLRACADDMAGREGRLPVPVSPSLLQRCGALFRRRRAFS